MLKKFNVDYDAENDSLLLYRGKSHGGIELSGIILDFDKEHALVGVELQHASSLLKDLIFSDVKVSKKTLQGVKSSRIDIRIKNQLLILKIFLLFEDHTELVAPITVPMIVEQNPLCAEI
jgi:uncharacterized protein YuzE